MATRKPYSLGQAMVKNNTINGLWVHVDDFGQDVFIPFSQIHEDSEVCDHNSDPGELVITEWLATERGWA